MKILSIKQLVDRANRRQVQGEFLDAYFSDLTANLRSSFVSEFDELQSVLVTYGSPGIDLTQPLLAHGSNFIAIFSNIEGKADGYFCPLYQCTELNWGALDKRAPCAQKELKDKFLFNGFQVTI